METKNSREGRRCPDLGNGKYLNPVVPGDHPDPTILKDGSDYYMTFSSFLSYPGVVIWHSRDLVNWSPIGAALRKPIGSVFALDLVKHGGRYFVYIPVVGGRQTIYAIWADRIEGPWSDPVDLGIHGCIDPGHAVGEDGKRYLFLDGIRRIGLSDDGLSTVGELEKVCSPWRYPEDWVVETYAPEGPKVLRRGGYFYLVSAVGGTAGPPTSHMVVVARSKSIHGPWEDCPRNPVVRTVREGEPWWSRGHASLVEGPSGDWWMVYHGYENGFRTLGRQTLLEPVRWTPDGWIEARGGDLSKPLRKPRGGIPSASGFDLSDDFSSDKGGIQWSFHNPGPGEGGRVSYAAGAMELSAKGSGPADSSPLCFVAVDRGYEAEVSLETGEEAVGGLLLFYDERMFCGMGFGKDGISTYNYGQEHSWMRIPVPAGRKRVRLLNDRNVVTMHYRVGDGPWTRHPWQMEVSGMHHNVFGGFTSLKVALFSAGRGVTRFSDFVYRGEELAGRSG